jgi:peroxiredoxin
VSEVKKGRTSIANRTITLKVGDEAPDFTLVSHTGEEVTLSQYRGSRYVVLLFLSAAFTATWRAQAFDSELSRARFEGAGAQVLGLTVDYRASLSAWAESLGGINYPLLSDFWPHGNVTIKYGVLRADGRAQRSVFVIDREGIVRYIDVHEQREQPDNEAIFEVLKTLGW